MDTEDYSLIIEDTSWTNSVQDIESFSIKVLKAAESFLSDDKVNGYEYGVLFTNDNHIHLLNRQYRNVDKPTNVLSFENIPNINGDIILAYETIKKEADEENKLLKDHLAHLLIHGRLHLAGYDHLNDKDADAMEALETKIMLKIGLPDPWKNPSATLT